MCAACTQCCSGVPSQLQPFTAPRWDLALTKGTRHPAGFDTPVLVCMSREDSSKHCKLPLGAGLRVGHPHVDPLHRGRCLLSPGVMGDGAPGSKARLNSALPSVGSACPILCPSETQGLSICPSPRRVWLSSFSAYQEEVEHHSPSAPSIHSFSLWAIPSCRRLFHFPFSWE